MYISIYNLFVNSLTLTFMMFPNEIFELIFLNVKDLQTWKNVRICCKQFYFSLGLRGIARTIDVLHNIEKNEKSDMFFSSENIALATYFKKENWSSAYAHANANANNVQIEDLMLKRNEIKEIITGEFIPDEHCTIFEYVAYTSMIICKIQFEKSMQFEYAVFETPSGDKFFDYGLTKNLFTGILPFSGLFSEAYFSCYPKYKIKIRIITSKTSSNTNKNNVVPGLVIKGYKSKLLLKDDVCESLVIETQIGGFYEKKLQNSRTFEFKHSISHNIVAICLKAKKEILFDIKRFQLLFCGFKIVDVYNPSYLLTSNLSQFIKKKCFDKVHDMINEIDTENTLVIPLLIYTIDNLPSATRAETISTVFEFNNIHHLHEKTIQTIFLSLNLYRRLHWLQGIAFHR